MKFIVLLLVTALAGCSSFSTSRTNIYSIRAEDGIQRYRVTCSGLFGGMEACRQRAAEVCEASHVVKIGPQEPAAVTFMCEASRAAR
ncbi:MULTISPECIES: hypothetical protein [Burkholderia]|uniref:Lipoprotein n=1 Tax=Burkholderia savannae TaxID=1637837 RepID=A0ABR5T288_9BURK|nr:MULTISPECIES: hypothetical protein [Burkholderia]AOJ72641.1 hypothetical protein WS78_28520 [Burkholderia savannae]AOJ84894.1 hypothetical protein WS86_30930 [Burkholderia savannae]AOK48945.1 hypothetical protein WT60_18315 [Burkholderia sp. MSMB617WGS]KVG45126.1 hypothetical protein WS77_08235 [Burkholderia sp. MSMB0265]KVG84140.1 hypothetical protein WS81_06935 [Burkholderia sp. MSMB2040]